MAKETTQNTANTENQQRPRREITGLVISDKMDKTIVVKVSRIVKHPLYGKYIKRTRKYKAHDGASNAKIGDFVRLVESRPLSKDKRFVLKEIIRKGGVAAGVDA